MKEISKSWIPDPSHARALRKLEHEKAKAAQAAERLVRQQYHLKEVAHGEAQIPSCRQPIQRLSIDLEEEIHRNQAQQEEDLACIHAENSSPEPGPSVSTSTSSAQPGSNFIKKLNPQPPQNPPSNQNSIRMLQKRPMPMESFKSTIHMAMRSNDAYINMKVASLFYDTIGI
ncbi:hypothetical protein IW262DRAFT_1289839 [Armillaria fumosa]|nr:hypothetical protein IW262DRAFT_1289839 [Armillaria fumosa]